MAFGPAHVLWPSERNPKWESPAACVKQCHISTCPSCGTTMNTAICMSSSIRILCNMCHLCSHVFRLFAVFVNRRLFLFLRTSALFSMNAFALSYYINIFHCRQGGLLHCTAFDFKHEHAKMGPPHARHARDVDRLTHVCRNKYNINEEVFIIVSRKRQFGKICSQSFNVSEIVEPENWSNTLWFSQNDLLLQGCVSIVRYAMPLLICTWSINYRCVCRTLRIGACPRS